MKKRRPRIIPSPKQVDEYLLRKYPGYTIDQIKLFLLEGDKKIEIPLDLPK